MRIEAGRTSYFEGNKITFVPDLLPKKRQPGSTAVHEATHGVVAIKTNTEVKSMTIVAGSDYLGLTELTGFNAAAALAPHEMGMGGTSYDVFIAESMGAGGAGSTGKAVAMASVEEIEAVAIALEENKTLSSSEIHRAMDQVKNPLPMSGTIYIETEDGGSKKVKAEVRDNIVISEDLAEVFGNKAYLH